MTTPSPNLAQETPLELRERLLAHAGGDPNDGPMASILSTWFTGGGALPAWLGLDPGAFHQLLAHHFPGLGTPAPPPHPEIDRERTGEYEELFTLLLRDRAGHTPSETWMAGIVAAGCLASDHLWQDLGLWNRGELSALMAHNFPDLAGRNVEDMKWKKFLYKQLCAAEGIYTCRAPSCEVCADYTHCFGPEE
ncbi:nitrogen fixation protein NifQ [Thioalbus denitrificans]|uniref:Nitrogen fixation protein NifQ n=1 Tax=Thioalbus denitrificans TaxID=547122 RepID=A0A369CJH3_9GAMM|nr:nitrogen fixation protein NifQ [Thioalbus denitrificans]RCX31994.1 nitrogen fixation protein NifQ [Thioalbus denitrificans]